MFLGFNSIWMTKGILENKFYYFCTLLSLIDSFIQKIYALSMFLDTLKESKKIPYDCLGDSELQLYFPNSNSRQAYVKRSFADEDLIPLRRGLYLLGEKHRRHSLNLFVLAQKIYGPSYISFESALAEQQWIPEAVYSISSACLKRSKNFNTPLAMFSYHKVICDSFLSQVKIISTEEGNYFIATPWRALADYVYVHQSNWKGLHPLIHSLRIEEESLLQSNKADLQELLEIYPHHGVQRFLKGALKELS